MSIKKYEIDKEIIMKIYENTMHSLLFAYVLYLHGYESGNKDGREKVDQ